MVHAQFETIHPYADGNGRVCRALLHTVLTRRGLTPTAVLPISLVLLTRLDDYVNALTAYRHDGPPLDQAATDGLTAWIELFLDATAVAVVQAAQFAAKLGELRTGWHERLAAWRAERGVRERPLGIRGGPACRAPPRGTGDDRADGPATAGPVVPAGPRRRGGTGQCRHRRSPPR
ncbi:MAG: Fic family protein [Actinomycetota bacterium]|nr:Fic family protein [Actinomycetota bacterium]